MNLSRGLGRADESLPTLNALKQAVRPMARARRHRVVLIALATVVLVITLSWHGMDHVSQSRFFPAYQKPASPRPSSAADDMISPLLTPSNSSASLNSSTVPIALKKENPSFHLLILASEPNPNLCKTLLSTFILDYPPPTLINFEQNSQDSNGKKASRVGKIDGVYDYLRKAKEVDEDDMALIIDGYDVWFQLPPEVMIKRYHNTVSEANDRLRSRYGLVVQNGSSGDMNVAPKYTERVIYGADKKCWSNDPADLACASVPASTLPETSYTSKTESDPKGSLTKPRFLNPGTVIGPVSDLKAIYESASRKIGEKDRTDIGEQSIFAEIFGEQEYQREEFRKSTQTFGSRWWEWISDKLNYIDGTANATSPKNMTVLPGQQYEFGIGLDYESSLFQAITHADSDVEMIIYNDTSLLTHFEATHPAAGGSPLTLPPEILHSTSPYSLHNATDSTQTTLPLSPTLDILPQNKTWKDVFLATNLRVPSISPLLHFNGDKSYLSSWWNRMWYQSDARALLRHYMRTPEGSHAAQAAAVGGQRWWNMRGGTGGVWTDKGHWLEWADICGGYEDIIFADGKGQWGKEEGSKKVYNAFGLLIYGDEEDDDDE
ncbi:MAG: hypothetical protein M1819_001110 [Sarea resinae]|nr:MAG: hypothetical protein M1819_001110 [Sarea resinae]